MKMNEFNEKKERKRTHGKKLCSDSKSKMAVEFFPVDKSVYMCAKDSVLKYIYRVGQRYKGVI